LSVPLGKWLSPDATLRSTRFERGRRTALGIAQGVGLQGLDNETRSFEDIGGGRNVITAARERGLGPQPRRGVPPSRFIPPSLEEKRQEIVQRYQEVPFERRGGFRSIMQSGLEADPILRARLDFLDRTGSGAEVD
jgi:hypothetical protein